jgi:hypothetical protein
VTDETGPTERATSIPSPVELVLLDVNETLFSLRPVADRMAEAGLDGELELWFTRILATGSRPQPPAGSPGSASWPATTSSSSCDAASSPRPRPR